ncbi:50S ribosomal protein L19e [Candidatus Woesearchaeota archaeon]|nr:50S ribosomal protein L19e [Candidatus Woesearchaeota archaeon]
MKNKKKLAAKILNVSPKKVVFSPEALDDIQKAITRSDMRGLIAVGKISTAKVNQHSRGGARKIAQQKSKGRQRGKGSRKGSKNSIVTRKEKWMIRVRAQRVLLKELRDKSLLSTNNYRMLYTKSKGGYFRNKRHIKLYLKEHHLIESGSK